MRAAKTDEIAAFFLQDPFRKFKVADEADGGHRDVYCLLYRLGQGHHPALLKVGRGR